MGKWKPLIDAKFLFFLYSLLCIYSPLWPIFIAILFLFQWQQIVVALRAFISSAVYVALFSPSNFLFQLIFLIICQRIFNNAGRVHLSKWLCVYHDFLCSIWQAVQSIYRYGVYSSVVCFKWCLCFSDYKRYVWTCSVIRFDILMMINWLLHKKE